jgi:FkbM family methyltransferase
MKQAFSRRLSNWLRPRNPYDWHYNGENWLLNRLARFRPSVAFDVGANVGDWLMLARNALPDSQLHAFEIVESTYAVLHDRFAGNAGVVLNNFGLSDRSGTITMHLFNGTNELTSHVAYPHGDYRDVICPVRRGDEYMQDRGIERIDFLKIDVEGAEHLVLHGFGAVLAEQIDVIQFEYGKVNIITHFLLRDFYEFLEARGYVVGKLFPDFVDFRAYALEDEDFSGPNYVAVRKTRSDIVDALSKHQPFVSGRFLLKLAEAKSVVKNHIEKSARNH